MRIHHAVVAAFAATAAAGCQTSPVTPTVIPPPPVAQVSTAQPLAWDSRDELAAWVNESTTGAVSLEGDGAGAVIRIDVGAGVVGLRGPDFEPAHTGVRGARVRYRWLNADDGGGYLGLTAYLRPPGFDGSKSVPRLFYSGGDLLTDRSGDWVDRVLKENIAAHLNATYDVRFMTIHMPRVDIVRTTPIQGIVEIDSIALVR